jgi:hypothetical protein
MFIPTHTRESILVSSHGNCLWISVESSYNSASLANFSLVGVFFVPVFVLHCLEPSAVFPEQH